VHSGLGVVNWAMVVGVMVLWDMVVVTIFRGIAVEGILVAVMGLGLVWLFPVVGVLVLCGMVVGTSIIGGIAVEAILVAVMFWGGMTLKFKLSSDRNG